MAPIHDNASSYLKFFNIGKRECRLFVPEERAVSKGKNMETIGFIIFCLAIAAVIFWSLIWDDRDEEALDLDPAASADEGNGESH